MLGRGDAAGAALCSSAVAAAAQARETPPAAAVPRRRAQVAWVRALAARHRLRLAPDHEPRPLGKDARHWVTRGNFNVDNAAEQARAKSVYFSFAPAAAGGAGGGARNASSAGMDSGVVVPRGRGLPSPGGAFAAPGRLQASLHPGFVQLNKMADWEVERRMGYERLVLPPCIGECQSAMLHAVHAVRLRCQGQQ